MDELKNINEGEELKVVQYIVVRLGEELYGIQIDYVDNIIRMKNNVTRVPKAQPYFIGVINLRGEVVPIMSLRKRFGLGDDVYEGATRIIILRLENQSLIGIIVDEVREVINLDETMIETPSFKLNEANAPYLAGIGKNGKDLISLLDIERVAKDKEKV